MNILIIRLSAIGDIVMASPLVSTLRRHYPDAKIYWLAQAECAEILENHPDLSGIITWRRKDWLDLWRKKKLRQLFKDIRNTRRQLRKYHFDTVFDIQGLLKSGFLAWLTGAKNRIGLGSKEGSKIFMSKVISRSAADDDLIGSEYRFLIEYFGCPVDEFPMQVWVNQRSSERAQNLIKKHNIEYPFVAICPFTTRPQKHWFNENWLQLVNLIEQKGLKCLMLGGPGDKAAAYKISKHRSVISLVGETSLQEAAEIIDQASALIGVDTGLTHIGHAKKTPTIALFGSTRPYLDAGTSTSKILYSNRSCSPCHRNPSCNSRFDCMRDLTPDKVMKELLAIHPTLCAEPA